MNWFAARNIRVYEALANLAENFSHASKNWFTVKSNLLSYRYCERPFPRQTRGRIRKSASTAGFGSHYSVLLFQQSVRHGENVHSSSSMHHRYSTLHRRGT